MVGTCPSLIQVITDPHTSRHTVVLFSVIYGALLGASVVGSFALRGQRKQDERLVRLFEEHFPDECSWKQEERILAEAEEIRLKAKVDLLIQQSGH